MEYSTKQNLKKAIFAGFCVFYFTFISLWFLFFFLDGTYHDISYWDAIKNLFIKLIRGYLMWFSLHLIVLILGFYFGIKNFQQGGKKKLFTLPIIFLTSSLLIPGLIPIVRMEAHLIPLIFLPPFYFSFIFLLLFTLLISAVFYFQKISIFLKL